jgi:hypothetical protein
MRTGTKPGRWRNGEKRKNESIEAKNQGRRGLTGAPLVVCALAASDGGTLA